MRAIYARYVGISAVAAVLALASNNSCAAQTKKIVDLGLSKNLHGDLEFSGRQTYKVKVENRSIEMLTVVLYSTTEVASAGDGDEFRRLFNGKLQLRWEITARTGNPPFGTVTGRFVWTDGVSRAEGTMEGTLSCGTHRSPLPGAVEEVRSLVGVQRS